MRLFFKLFILFYCLKIHSNCIITITSPKEFEIWHVCNKYEIKWSMQNDNQICNNLRIELYQEGIFLMTIIEDTENDGLFIWEIPQAIYGLRRGELTIRIFNKLNGEKLGESGVFLILDSCNINYEYILPVVANAQGAYESYWKTEVILENWTDYYFDYYLYFSEDLKEKNSPHGIFYRLEPNSIILIENILQHRFSRFGSGSLFIDSYSFDPTEPVYQLRIPSRTYNLKSDGGTFGSAIFSINKIDNEAFYGSLIYLRQNDRFRTNIGIVNMENYPVDVKIKLYDKHEVVGEKLISLPAYGFYQENSVFKQFTNKPIEFGSASVYPIDEISKIYSYGSVIDNMTNDPYLVFPY